MPQIDITEYTRRVPDEWHRLACEIARAFYGKIFAEVPLRNGKIADIVINPIAQDPDGRVNRCERIIEANAGYRCYDDELKKYCRICRWLEVWYLYDRLGQKRPQPPRLIIKGPYELSAKLLRLRRKDLISKMIMLKLNRLASPQDLVIMPYNLRKRIRFLKKRS